MSKIILLLCLLGIVFGLHLESEAEEQETLEYQPKDQRLIKSGKYRFLNDEGKYLAHVQDQNSRLEQLRATFSDSGNDSSTIWTVEADRFTWEIFVRYSEHLLDSRTRRNEAVVTMGRPQYDNYCFWHPQEQSEGKWRLRDFQRKFGYLGACPSEYGQNQEIVCITRRVSSRPSTIWTLIEVTDA